MSDEKKLRLPNIIETIGELVSNRHEEVTCLYGPAPEIDIPKPIDIPEPSTPSELDIPTPEELPSPAGLYGPAPEFKPIPMNNSAIQGDDIVDLYGPCWPGPNENPE